MSVYRYSGMLELKKAKTFLLIHLKTAVMKELHSYIKSISASTERGGEAGGKGLEVEETGAGVQGKGGGELSLVKVQTCLRT